MTGGLTLLTFAPMIDSETSRLLLRHYAIDYREEPHAFGWGSALALLRAGTVQVPVLYGNGLRLAGPRAIVDRFDVVQPPERALLPADAGLRSTVEADWAQFHGTLADKTAVLAYYHLLPHRDIMMEAFTRGIPASEVSAGRMVYPLLHWLLATSLRLTDANARDALAQIRAIFDQIDARVDDGRRTLFGDRLTLGDLALAAAAAPVLLPDGNSSPIPPLARMPAAYATIVAEMRAHPTAGFVQDIYRALQDRSAALSR